MSCFLFFTCVALLEVTSDDDDDDDGDDDDASWSCDSDNGKHVLGEGSSVISSRH